MHCLVTGAAGFIGSHLVENLVKRDWRVTAIDGLVDSYPREIREKNISQLLQSDSFHLVRENLLHIDLRPYLESVDYVFHMAAQTGVRTSWGKDFETYVKNNILATQRVLEAVKDAPIKKFVYASSSSVYGKVQQFPTTEETKPEPISPYGVTKLSGEHLCHVYHKIWGVPMVILRYFTVYGPRQRPDMAFFHFITALRKNQDLIVFGDGQQSRDFTHVDDVIRATCSVLERDVAGETFNIGGGSRITVTETIHILEEIMGARARIKYIEKQKGDMVHTAADIKKAQAILDYSPRTVLEEGLRSEVNWVIQNAL